MRLLFVVSFVCKRSDREITGNKTVACDIFVSMPYRFDHLFKINVIFAFI